MQEAVTGQKRRGHRKGIKATIIACVLLFLFYPLFSFVAHATTPSDPVLSLENAIQLALRDSPNVQQATLAETLQRLSVDTEEWRFRPHLNMSINASTDRVAIAPEISYLSPIGTDVKMLPNNINTSHTDSRVSFKVSQPLLRGFGRPIVEAALHDARDSEKIARLHVEGSLRTTVTGVINAYLDVVAAKKTVEIDESALKRAVESVKQTALFIQSGRKAGNELVTVKANVATAKASLENSKNSLSQMQYALLMAIGLDPNKSVSFSELDVQSLIKRYELLSLDVVKKLSVDNDIQYQTDVITLQGVTTRSLMLAEDRTRLSLSLDLQHNIDDSASVSLTIPIDDQAAKQSVASAKIALKQANLNLKTAKWNKEVNAISNWKTVLASKRALSFALDAEKLQEKTYHLNYQKYLHGLIDSLELQTAQVQLIQAQHSLLTAQIAYLKSLVGLDYLIGHTLKTWHVNTRLA